MGKSFKCVVCGVRMPSPHKQQGGMCPSCWEWAGKNVETVLDKRVRAHRKSGVSSRHSGKGAGNG